MAGEQITAPQGIGASRHLAVLPLQMQFSWVKNIGLLLIIGRSDGDVSFKVQALRWYWISPAEQPSFIRLFPEGIRPGGSEFFCTTHTRSTVGEEEKTNVDWGTNDSPTDQTDDTAATAACPMDPHVLLGPASPTPAYTRGPLGKPLTRRPPQHCRFLGSSQAAL